MSLAPVKADRPCPECGSDDLWIEAEESPNGTFFGYPVCHNCWWSG